MKIRIITGLAVLLSVAATQAQYTVDIDPVGGKLTASIPTNSVYSIQWAGTLDPTNRWYRDWSHLRNQKSEDGSVEIDVPLAFKLTCWTNGLFVNPPVGRTYYYSVTNQLGDTWTNEVQVLGDTYIPALTNSYRTMWKEDWYAAPYLIPVGAESRGAVFMRSDENGAYVLDSLYQPGPIQEDLIWTNGPVGTTWSFEASGPHTTIHSEIVAIEDVIIGTNTYENCIKIHSVGDNQFWYGTNYPVRAFTEWIQPGGYLVKRMNWWLGADYTNAAPVVTELQYWEDL